MKYKYKSNEIEAIQYDGKNRDDLVVFVEGHVLTKLFGGHSIIENGDWIVKDRNKFYLYPPEKFEIMFESVR